jgi:hypothetical protein
MEISKLLKDEGFEVVEGMDAVLAAIKAEAGHGQLPLCSGYGVFPDGRKCLGCSDCGQEDRRGVVSDKVAIETWRVKYVEGTPLSENTPKTRPKQLSAKK